MTYQEVLVQAREAMAKCKACPVCNGKACGNNIPGPGSKGIGDTAMRNYAKWLDMSVDWLYRIFGKPEFVDKSTSKMMGYIRELGFAMPGQSGGEYA